MSAYPSTRTACATGAVIVVLVVLAAAGFCALEGHGEHHAETLGLCVATVAADPACIPITAWLVVGSAVILALGRLTLTSPGVPVPPPKRSLSL